MNTINENRPLVSVIIPAYNAEAYIDIAVRSVLSQTVADLEVLVFDDCSGDRTAERIRQLAAEDPRVRPWFNEENIGVARTRNKGLDLASGDYVALLDADDLWYPDKLEKQIALMRSTNADLVYSGYALVDNSGKKIKDFCAPPTETLESLLTQNGIGCSTVLLSRNVVDHYRFRTDYYHEDYVLWIQLLQDGKKAVGIPQPLVDYRVHANSRAYNKLSSSLHRWHIYHSFLGFSALKSGWITLKYAVMGLKKHVPGLGSK